MGTWGLWGSEECVRYLRAGVRDGCELLCGGWVLRLSPLQEQGIGGATSDLNCGAILQPQYSRLF